MIWSRETIQGLSEQDLCLQVLIPLFQEMGYRDVRYYHGGVLEQGKDIVMWKADELRDRVNYAVVVKAEKISGAANIVSVVAFQAQQALGSDFVDEVTQEVRTIHEVLIVTSREITKEGHEALASALKGAGARNVSKIDGSRLWGLVEKHLPHEKVFSTLADAVQALNSADAEYGYAVEATPEKVNLTIFPKHGRDKPVPVAFVPRFPDTPEGREQQSAFRHFLATGQPTDINAEYLTIRGLPTQIAKMMEGAPGGILHLGPQTSSVKLAVSIHFRTTGESKDSMYFPLVELSVDRIGEVEAFLSNDQQAIPFKFYLTFKWGDKQANLRWDFVSAEGKAFSLLRAAEFEDVMSKGGTLTLRDYASGQRVLGFSVSPGTIEPPGESFVDLLRKLVWIQQQLDLDLDLPERDLFEPDDIREILQVEAILRTGKPLGRFTEVNVVFSEEGTQKLLASHPDGVLGEMRYLQAYKESLLGEEVDLGPVELTAKKVYVDPDDLEALKRSPGEAGSIRIRPDGGVFEAKFIDWPRPTLENAD